MDNHHPGCQRCRMCDFTQTKLYHIYIYTHIYIYPGQKARNVPFRFVCGLAAFWQVLGRPYFEEYLPMDETYQTSNEINPSGDDGNLPSNHFRDLSTDLVMNPWRDT